MNGRFNADPCKPFLGKYRRTFQRIAEQPFRVEKSDSYIIIYILISIIHQYCL